MFMSIILKVHHFIAYLYPNLHAGVFKPGSFFRECLFFCDFKGPLKIIEVYVFGKKIKTQCVLISYLVLSNSANMHGFPAVLTMTSVLL